MEISAKLYYLQNKNNYAKIRRLPTTKKKKKWLLPTIIAVIVVIAAIVTMRKNCTWMNNSFKKIISASRTPTGSHRG